MKYADFFGRDKPPRPTNTISFNGPKCAGKSTVSEKLEEDGHGISFNFFTLREAFTNIFYQHLKRKGQIKNMELYGASGLMWFATFYHWKLKEYADNPFILDHYIADYWVQSVGAPPFGFEELEKVIKHLDLPCFKEGHHFYLNIDYETYLQRNEERNTERGIDSTFVEEGLFMFWQGGYRQLVEDGYLIEIDATQPLKTVYEEIKQICEL